MPRKLDKLPTKKLDDGTYKRNRPYRPEAGRYLKNLPNYRIFTYQTEEYKANLEKELAKFREPQEGHCNICNDAGCNVCWNK
jgi:hypothetical protein